MIRRGALDLPIIGIARSVRDIDELRARVRASLESTAALMPTRSGSSPPRNRLR